LSSYEQEKNGKTRVYYSISKQGKSFLKEKAEEWDVYVRAVSNVLSMS
jgi:DNA-binding PadR family transcriptional regulator